MDWGEPNKGSLLNSWQPCLYIALANLDRVSVAGIQERPGAYLPYFSGKQGFWKALKFIEDLEFGKDFSERSY